MILNTGNRTDIPAFYSQWFYNRIANGSVMVRNPYNPQRITRYSLSPDTVDLICFCTKNPKPMLKDIHRLNAFRQLWYVTITPYGKDIEPGVSDKHEILQSFQQLSVHTGSKNIIWRYDPIFLNEKYTIDYHLRAFQTMAETLRGYTDCVVISFIDLYEKTKKNFPSVQPVPTNVQRLLTTEIVRIAQKNGMTVKPCLEDPSLSELGADCSGCMNQQVLETAVGQELIIPNHKKPRQGCSCVLSDDIGAYNTCAHLCKYCYANYSPKRVRENRKQHNVDSPLLIGTIREEDVIVDAVQKSWLNPQLTLF